MVDQFDFVEPDLHLVKLSSVADFVDSVELVEFDAVL